MKNAKLFLPLILLIFLINTVTAQTQTALFDPEKNFITNGSALVDSIITYRDQNSYKISITHNAAGNLADYKSQIWDDTSGTWLNLSQYIYTYDDSGKVLHYKQETWDGDLKTWVNSLRYVYTYDSNGKRTKYSNEKWDKDLAVWVSSYQFTYSYDDSGNETVALRENWDTQTLSWTNATQSLNSFDDNGNRTLQMLQKWDNNLNDWVYTYAYVSEYDSVGNLTMYVTETRSAENTYWIRTGKWIYQYYTGGKLTYETFLTYNQNQMDWRMASKTEYLYSGYNFQLFLDSKTTTLWNATTSTWSNDKKYTYNRDNNGNLLMELYQLWQIDSETWGNATQDNYEYDENGNRIHFSAEDWDGAQWIRGKRSCIINDRSAEFSLYCEELYAYYSAYTTRIEDENPARVKRFTLQQNYPNPFNPVTSIQYEIPVSDHVELKIFDISGRLVQTLVSGIKQAGHHHAVFNSAGLASGIYLYRIQTGNEVKVKRMLLIK